MHKLYHKIIKIYFILLLEKILSSYQ